MENIREILSGFGLFLSAFELVNNRLFSVDFDEFLRLDLTFSKRENDCFFYRLNDSSKLGFNRNFVLKIKANPSLFPKLSFDKFNQNFVLYYNGPKDFGQLSFTFDYDDLILAFNMKKFKHDTPKLYYSDFISSFQSFFKQPFNDYLKIALSCFSITPTILKKAVHQNKKLKRKISLQPKFLAVSRLFT